jgi:hypothetical protein|tara:strand:- start:8 stop:202 length:195 start_codon:yes stop_codon:yes gene_type:complete
MPFISPYPTSSNKAATMHVTVEEDEIACISATVVFGKLPNQECPAAILIASVAEVDAVPASKTM